MRNRIHPRTGKIVRQEKPIPIKKQPKVKQPEFKCTQPQLEKIIRQLGDEIIKQILEKITFQKQDSLSIKEPLQNNISSYSIQIDETLIDVGIEEQDMLRLGEESSITKQEAIIDDQLVSTRNKLKALKRG